MDTSLEFIPDAPAIDEKVFSRVLVVIPTLNEEKHIRECISSLLDGSPETRAARLVVVDGCSTDETQDIVRKMMAYHPNLHLLENARKIQSAAINLAVDTLAKPDDLYLLRCDAHADYPANYIKQVVETLVEKDCASVASVMDSTGETCFAKAAAWAVDTKIGSGGSAHRGGQSSGYVLHGHHAGIRLDWFRKIGGYDANKAINEDAEFDIRLIRAGGRIWLDADIRLVYKMRGTPKALWRQYSSYGMGRADTMITHRTRPQIRQLIPVLNLILLVSGGLLAVPFPVALVWPITYATMLLGVSLWSTAVHRDACFLWSGVSLAIMHQAWAFGFIRQTFNRLRGHSARRT